jgi:hypothetical protein
MSQKHYNSQVVESSSMPNNQWMDKENVVYIHKEVLLSDKEEWNCVHLQENGWKRRSSYLWSKPSSKRIYIWIIFKWSGLQENLDPQGSYHTGFFLCVCVLKSLDFFLHVMGSPWRF